MLRLPWKLLMKALIAFWVQIQYANLAIFLFYPEMWSTQKTEQNSPHRADVGFSDNCSPGRMDLYSDWNIYIDYKQHTLWSGVEFVCLLTCWFSWSQLIYLTSSGHVSYGCLYRWRWTTISHLPPLCNDNEQHRGLLSVFV